MNLDLHFLSQQLLELLANSIHDRDNCQNDFCFNVKELHVVEDWLNEIIVQNRKAEAKPVL